MIYAGCNARQEYACTDKQQAFDVPILTRLLQLQAFLNCFELLTWDRLDAGQLSP